MTGGIREQKDLTLRDKATGVKVAVLYMCPQCEHLLCRDEGIREKFCPECGQRLDWSNVNNEVMNCVE